MSVTDFRDVAARMVAGLAGIRGCLVVSRDGLSLGTHPAEGEARAREAWDSLQQIGDPQRGFVDMGMELWVISRRGPYGAIVVASPEVKPGLLLDRMDAALLQAEEARARQAEEPPGRTEPVRRPRSPLHPEPRLEPPAEPVKAAAKPANAPAVVDLGASEASSSSVDTSTQPAPPTRAFPTPAFPAPAPVPESTKPDASSPPEVPDPDAPKPLRARGEVDRVALAREFGRLFSEGKG